MAVLAREDNLLLRSGCQYGCRRPEVHSDPSLPCAARKFDLLFGDWRPALSHRLRRQDSGRRRHGDTAAAGATRPGYLSPSMGRRSGLRSSGRNSYYQPPGWRGGVRRRLPRRAVQGRDPGPRGLARLPCAGDVRARGDPKRGQPATQFVQTDARREGSHVAGPGAEPEEGEAHPRGAGEGRPLQGRPRSPEGRQRTPRGPEARVPRTRDVGRRLRVPPRSRAAVGQAEESGARRHQGGPDGDRRRVRGMRRAGRQVLERLPKVRGGLRLVLLLAFVGFLRGLVLFRRLDLHCVRSARFRAEDRHRVVQLLRPLAALDAHAAVGTVLRVEVLLVPGEEDLAVAVRPMQGPRVAHDAFREDRDAAVAELRRHPSETKARAVTKLPTPTARPGGAHKVKWSGFHRTADDAGTPVAAVPRSRRRDLPPRGGLADPGRLRLDRGRGPRGPSAGPGDRFVRTREEPGPRARAAGGFWGDRHPPSQ